MNLPRSEESSATNSVEEDYYKSFSRSESMTVTLIGKIRTLAGLERNEWIFVVLSVSCILVTMGLTIERLVTTIKSDSEDYVFGILLIINAGFCLFYTIHGILREREFELYCLIGAIILVSVYVIVNFGMNVNSLSSVKLARVILIVLVVPVIIGFAWVVGHGFGYLEFRTVGAGAEVQAMYRAASRFSGLLKFDYQLTVILLVLTIENCSHLTYFSKCSIAAGIPLQMLWALIGWIAMRTEQLILVWPFLLLCLAEPIYIGLRILQFAESWSHYNSSEIRSLTYSFIAAAAGAIIVRILVVSAFYVVIKNFGRGLKYKVFQLPMNRNDPPVLPSKRDMKKCCGMVCCGPLG